MEASTSPVQGDAGADNPEIPLRARLKYWAIAWAIALSLTWLIVFPAPTGVVFLPQFAAGLFIFLPIGPALAAGWATYLILTVILLRCRGRARYRMLLVVLCVLFAVNIAGCKHIVRNTHFQTPF
jgi:hypothetical protein